MANSFRSLTYVAPKGRGGKGVVPGQPPADPLAEYMKDFAKIIPAEAIAAYTTLTAVASSLASPGAGQLAVAWGCLLATLAIRLLTGHEPGGGKLQWLPGLSAALAFALYVYSQGGDLGYRFGFPEPVETDPVDNLKIWASLLVGFWAAFAPVIVPRLMALFSK